MELQTDRFIKIEADWKAENFKKEWSDIELEGVERILDKLIAEEYNITKSNAEMFFELAYTSSGRWAEHGVTNPRYTIEGNKLEAFLISNNNVLVAFCQDQDENDIFYAVE